MSEFSMRRNSRRTSPVAGNCRSLALRLAGFALAAIAVLCISAPHAAAQGCAMCYQSAASSGSEGRLALRHGILILLLPAVSLFVGIFVLIYHRRDPV